MLSKHSPKQVESCKVLEMFFLYKPVVRRWAKTCFIIVRNLTFFKLMIRYWSRPKEQQIPAYFNGSVLAKKSPHWSCSPACARLCECEKSFGCDSVSVSDFYSFSLSSFPLRLKFTFFWEHPSQGRQQNNDMAADITQKNNTRKNKEPIKNTKENVINTSTAWWTCFQVIWNHLKCNQPSKIQVIWNWFQAERAAYLNTLFPVQHGRWQQLVGISPGSTNSNMACFLKGRDPWVRWKQTENSLTN